MLWTVLLRIVCVGIGVFWILQPAVNGVASTDLEAATEAAKVGVVLEASTATTAPTAYAAFMWTPNPVISPKQNPPPSFLA